MKLKISKIGIKNLKQYVDTIKEKGPVKNRGNLERILKRIDFTKH